MPNLSGISTYLPVNSETYSSALSATIAAGAATVPVTSASPYTDGDIVVLTVEPDAANEATFVGTKSGSSFINCAWTEGNTGVGHSGGATIKDYDSATHFALLSAALRAVLNQNATLKSGLTYPTPTFTGVMTFPINAVPASALATAAITLGYSQDVDGQSIASTIEQDITNCSVTVTVPAGGRRIKITGFVPFINTAAGTNAGNLQIKEGATRLSYIRANLPNNEAVTGWTVTYVSNTAPSAGSHTYKLTWISDVASSITLNSAADAPMFILVEYI